MAKMPPMELLKLWRDQADDKFVLNYNKNPDNVVHPALLNVAHEYYIRGYIKCKFEQWIEEETVASFRQQLGDSSN